MAFALTNSRRDYFHVLLSSTRASFVLGLVHRDRRDGPRRITGSIGGPTLVGRVVHSLPLALGIGVTRLSVGITSLARVGTKSVLPVSLKRAFPITVKRSRLFDTLVIRSGSGLFLSRLTNGGRGDRRWTEECFDQKF